MDYRLLLVDAQGAVTVPQLRIRTLREFPGSGPVSIHFRPVRNDLLFESAKFAGSLAFRILSGEGVIRGQLWAEFEVPGEHVNVVGRSSDLLFALALITAAWKQPGNGALIAATGVLDAEGAVQSVDRTAEKVAAAVRNLPSSGHAIVFYPAADAPAVESWRNSNPVPEHIALRPVAKLDEAIEHLGYALEKVYLRNPFRGLEHFDYEHRAIFFGRDAEIRQVVEQLLRREANRVPGLLLEGASGCGKSSFIRAGLLPAMINPSSLPAVVAEGLRDRPVRLSARHAIWRVGGSAGFVGESQIAQSLLECWRGLPELAEKLPLHCASLGALGDEWQRHWPRAQRFVWFIDQFEELFAIGLDASVIEALGRLLLRLQAGGAWTLACIRADAAPQLKQHATMRDVFGSNEGQYYLETVTGAALDDVIARPAESAGLTFSVGASGKRLDQLLREEAYKAGENALPLLQFTLYELYRQRLGSELAFGAYERLGGLSGSIATAAESVLSADPVEFGRVLPRIFRSLVSVDDEGRPAKRSAPLEEMSSGSTVQQRLLDLLVQARLCVTDQREGIAVVAFAHEALLRTWPRLRDWLTEEGALLQARDLLVAEARRWEQHGKHRDWLVTAADRLASIRSVIDAAIPVPAIARQFADQSSKRAQRATHLRQLAVASIAALAVTAAVFGVHALRARDIAATQRDAALLAQQRSLTEIAAARLGSVDVPGALGIVLEVLADQARTHAYSSAALNVFQEASAADKLVLAITGHTGRVNYAAWSFDGHRIISTSDDSTARIWDADSGRETARLTGHSGRVLRGAFSPDGRSVATVAMDHTIRVWDAASGQEKLRINGGTGGINTAPFSFDGRRIVAGTADNAAHIWDAASGRELVKLRGNTERLTAAVLSPDGRRVVTATEDKLARVWDAATGRELLQLRGHTGRVYSADFSADGMRVVTASDDKTARVWDSQTGRQLTLMNGHTDSLLNAAFSPDGKRVVTASFDRTIRIWAADTGQLLETLGGNTSVLKSVAFSPDGARVVSASGDGVRLWDTDPDAAIWLTDLDRLVGAAYSPDGRRVVTSSYDKTARVWDAASGKLLLVLRGHTDTLGVANFSPDGRHIATGSLDRTARLWDADTGREIAVFRGHTAQVPSLAFSPDGRQLATVSNDGTGRIWDVATGTELLRLDKDSDLVNIMFSPDGRYLVFAANDKRAHVWDVVANREVLTLSGHSRGLTNAEYSPDGRRIVTSSADNTARIWDVASGRELVRLSGHRNIVGVATFSPDGRYIATASADNTARVWDAATGYQVKLLSGHTEPVTSVMFSPDGARLMTAGFDGAVRLFDAHVLPLETQITWAEAARFDPLSTTERVQFGLPAPSGVRSWPDAKSECDEAAAAAYDPDRRAPGVQSRRIDADIALAACSSDNDSSRDGAGRVGYQHGRVLVAKGEWVRAREDFEQAVRSGYRSARIDLGLLLSRADTGMTDERKAEALFRQAWEGGVTVAAFELARLYEQGTSAVADPAQAWSWYEKGAAAAEPNALARLGAREDERAAAATVPAVRNAHWIRSFMYYASAAERARFEDWPAEFWRDWRYRRASLARLLARQGMMRQVAEEFGRVRRQYSPTANQ